MMQKLAQKCFQKIYQRGRPKKLQEEGYHTVKNCKKLIKTPLISSSLSSLSKNPDWWTKPKTIPMVRRLRRRAWAPAVILAFSYVTTIIPILHNFSHIIYTFFLLTVILLTLTRHLVYFKLELECVVWDATDSRLNFFQYFSFKIFIFSTQNLKTQKNFQYLNVSPCSSKTRYVSPWSGKQNLWVPVRRRRCAVRRGAAKKFCGYQFVEDTVRFAAKRRKNCVGTSSSKTLCGSPRSGEKIL